jgi:hypothetical protein
MTIEDELACLKIAYRNSINDLARIKGHLQQAEETLLILAKALQDAAGQLNVTRADNPGTGGSGR